MGYKVKVPSNASLKTVYTSTATFKNADITNPIISSEAEANIGSNIVNPKTGSLSYEIMLVILIVSISSVLFFIRKNIIKGV